MFIPPVERLELILFAQYEYEMTAASQYNIQGVLRRFNPCDISRENEDYQILFYFIKRKKLRTTNNLYFYFIDLNISITNSKNMY